MSKSIKEITQELVAVRSDYPNASEKNVGQKLIKLLEQLGFTVEVEYSTDSEERFNIFASRGQGDKALLFYGHQDTVPVTDEQLWTHNPFAGEVVGDRLFGLGSYDMKGGIAAFLFALDQVKNSYTKVFLAFDEENISEGAWQAVQQKKEFFNDVELVISPEPNFGLGINNIPTARPGRSVFEVKIQVSGAHVAEYSLGGDAVIDLSHFALDFDRLFHNEKEKFFNSKYSLAMIRRVFSESVGITAPSEALLQVELYLDKSDDEKQFLNAMQSLTAAHVSLIPRKTPYLKGYRFVDFPHKTFIEEMIKKYTGKNFTNDTYSAVGDDNVVASMGAPVLTWGPDGANAHAVDEYVDLKSLETLSKMFIELLLLRSKM